MVIRRILLGACAVLIATGGPAAADHSYSHVLGETSDRPAAAAGSLSATATSATASSAEGSNLARTGSSAIVPLAQIATVLIGGGALLVLATRRRSGSESTATI